MGWGVPNLSILRTFEEPCSTNPKSYCGWLTASWIILYLPLWYLPVCFSASILETRTVYITPRAEVPGLGLNALATERERSCWGETVRTPRHSKPMETAGGTAVSLSQQMPVQRGKLGLKVYTQRGQLSKAAKGTQKSFPTNIPGKWKIVPLRVPTLRANWKQPLVVLNYL